MRSWLFSLSILMIFPYAEARVTFPKGFRWCVATAAHQIEGGNFASDWWRFENQPGHMKRSENSEIADDHWNKVDEDVGLLSRLHVTDYRMSVEWAKIEPRQGAIDADAVEHYRMEIQSLLAAGIRPIITLHHFTLPLWVSDKGGFEWDGFPNAFSNFANLVYTKIAPDVTDWITINEPLIYLVGGYSVGQSPPGEKRELSDLAPVARGILKAHAAAYHRLHRLGKNSGKKVRVGMAHHLRTIDPLEGYLPTDILAARVSDEAFNWALPEALETGRLHLNFMWQLNVDEVIPHLKGTQDFVGVNYYSGDLVHLSSAKGFVIEKRPEPRSDLDWPIYPEGLLRILRNIHERYPNKPITITENGIADSSDNRRPQFIVEHLSVVSQAIAEGIPVDGYCHWSLYDNFEWFEGYQPRFGLFEVDYSTLKRRARPSAVLFASIAEKNGF